jgi:ATP-dependent DNA helicase RecG
LRNELTHFAVKLSLPCNHRKLQKFFKLETERGFDNRAVVGGLEKNIPSWQAEARRENLDENIIQSIVKGLNQYAALSATDREPC